MNEITLYSIKSLSVCEGTFNRPFVAPTDRDAVTLVRNAILGGQDAALVYDRANLELHRVGSFDVRNGRFKNSAKLLIRLDHIALPADFGKISEKEAKDEVQ